MGRERRSFERLAERDARPKTKAQDTSISGPGRDTCGSKNAIEAPTSSLYTAPVFRLTKREQVVLCAVFVLLLVGWSVRAFRIAHPSPPVVEQRIP